MKSVCSVEVGVLPFKRWESNPFVPVDWRSRDAESLIAGEATEWADDDDRFVAAYAGHLRLLAAGDVKPAQPAAASQWAANQAARGCLPIGPIRSNGRFRHDY